MSGTNASRPHDAALNTIPKLLLRNAEKFASRPAYREKYLGIWQTWDWRETRQQIRDFALGLNALGLARGDKVAIVGDNRPRLYATFVTSQSLGAVPVPVYQDSVADEMAFVLEHAGVKFAVVEDQEQVDKLLSIADQVPTLERSSTLIRAACRNTITPTCMASTKSRSSAAPSSRSSRAWNSGGWTKLPAARVKKSVSCSTHRARQADRRACF